MIDFHTHVLPGIDDGSKNREESELILEQQQKEGVVVSIATPHFYPNMNVQAFLESRDQAYRVLTQEKENEHGEIRKGAEILLSVDTPKIACLKELAISHTPYILIEMYMGDWQEWMYVALQEIMDHHKLIPIIAHIERYDLFEQTLEPINRLADMGILFQVNAKSFDPKSRKAALIKKLMKKELVHVIGSDVHRAETLVTVKQAYQWIEKAYGKEAVDRLKRIGEEILQGSYVHKTLNKPFKKYIWGWM